MNDPIKDAVAEAVHGELAVRIRAKVREKWGPDPNELPTDGEMPGSAIPRITGVEVVAPTLGSTHPGVEPVPRGILKEIRQRPRVGHEQVWEMFLGIGGCEVHVIYAMSDVALASMRGPQAKEAMLREMINRGALAVMELLRKGIAEDLLEKVKVKGWNRAEGIGGFLFTEGK